MESVLTRMSWKAHADKISKQNNPFRDPSNKTPPTILKMKSFENDVLNFIENIKFRNAENQFQKSFKNDLKKINSSPSLRSLAVARL